MSQESLQAFINQPSSAGDSPARISHTQDLVVGSTERSQGSGKRLCGLSKKFPQSGFSVKTCRLCEREDSHKCSVTFPKLGMMRNGIVTERPGLTPLTKESGSSLLPTVTANTAKNTSLGINWNMREKKCHLDGVFMNQHGLKTGERLQPAFLEWMMGFPIGWTEVQHSETQSSRSKPIRSSKQLRKSKKAELAQSIAGSVTER